MSMAVVVQPAAVAAAGSMGLAVMRPVLGTMMMLVLLLVVVCATVLLLLPWGGCGQQLW